MNIKLTKVSKKKIADVKNRVKDLKEKLENVNNVLDKQEQYSRRHCLLLHELDESNNDIADDLVIELMNNVLIKN